ncbi:hypothetical protein BKM04_21005 [Pseudomonas syringae pv. syringae]|nr:hypothetical protein BKM04_21005 [Pseudomonas syringae pv. syringae]POD58052.1 hypothetical protein BKM06_22685 [Pseudomonas syringae pv. syringae]
MKSARLGMQLIDILAEGLPPDRFLRIGQAKSLGRQLKTFQSKKLSSSIPKSTSLLTVFMLVQVT